MATTLKTRQMGPTSPVHARDLDRRARPRALAPCTTQARLTLRQDLVKRARRRITDGTYDSPKCLDAVVERLWATLM